MHLLFLVWQAYKMYQTCTKLLQATTTEPKHYINLSRCTPETNILRRLVFIWGFDQSHVAILSEEINLAPNSMTPAMETLVIRKAVEKIIRVNGEASQALMFKPRSINSPLDFKC